MHTIGANDTFQERRERMVDWNVRGAGVSDARILSAMRSVPRHFFVPAHLRDLAYTDREIAIRYGQTLSAPSTAAKTIAALRLDHDDRVLDIGCGPGFTAAVLALVARETLAVEIVPELADEAARNLLHCGIDNARVLLGDGRRGHAELAPFDAILVEGAMPRIPEVLVDQLAIGGRLVIPVGGSNGQALYRVTKSASSGATVESLGPCSFAPLSGESDPYGY